MQLCSDHLSVSYLGLHNFYLTYISVWLKYEQVEAWWLMASDFQLFTLAN